MINKLIREPLLHFILLGALIYLTSIVWGNKDSQQHIIVSEGQIKHLATLYRKTWQRQPSVAELENLVQEHVLEQAAYYEGLELGLDKNDIVIVRRVRQKLDFIAEEDTPRPEATDERLSVYLQNNPDKFLVEQKLSLRQVYLDPKKHGGVSWRRGKELLAELTTQADQNIDTVGDRHLFKPFYQRQTVTELERQFGRDFAQSVVGLDVGSWQGPIRSAFGIHLVYVEASEDGIVPELDQIRSAVFREWENSFKERSSRRYYEELLRRYPVTIHWPTTDAPLADEPQSSTAGQQ